MATYLIAGGTAVVAVALVPTVARILSKILPANDKPGTPPVREAGKTSGFKKVTHDLPSPHRVACTCPWAACERSLAS